MGKGDRLSRKEKKEIRQKRRALRRDLRKKGIRSRQEFEIIARSLGLVYATDRALLVPWWVRLGNWISGMGVAGVVTSAAILTAGLGAVFTYSALYNEKGNFTVSVDGNLLAIGFDMSDTEDFADPKVRLKSEVLEEVNAISIEDIQTNLDTDYEGSHNLDNVVAYTYWVRNAGEETFDFDWYMVLTDSTRSVEDCVWMMIYEEGEQVIYAKGVEATGEPEHLSGYLKPPFYDSAKDPENQYYRADEGTWGIRTTPYVEDRIVAKDSVFGFEPGETRKYTVVIWIEGNDPECTNDILGGHAGYTMKYTIQGDEANVFDDLMFDGDEAVLYQPDAEEDSDE